MLKIALISSLISISFSLFVLTVQAQPTYNTPNEEEAVSKLIDYIEKSRIYPNSLRCASIILEDEGSHFFQYAIQEKHGNGCPGDPMTSSVRDRFRLFPNSNVILQYDVISDEWYPVTE